VLEELKDGALIVAMTYAGTDYLSREILKFAGDAAVIEPDDARAAVLETAERLAGRVAA
jgi:predicted DNA-binding transcriptional regulator YafY